MSYLAHLCSRWRFAVVGAWVVVLLALAGSVVAAGTGFTEVTDLPDGEANQAYALLDQAGGTTETENGRIVWHTEDTAVDDPQIRSEVTRLLDDVSAMPGVEAVVSPYSEAGSAQINAGADTAFATVALTEDADPTEIRELAEELDSGTLEVALGGQAFVETPSAGAGTEVVGILAALLILLLIFRSVWAALLPIVTGIAGVGVSLLLVMLGSHAVDLADTSITMGALIGLGVGIDYALFIVNRHRKALTSGATVREAIIQAVNTSGRAVVFAGLTVVIALLAIRVVGLGILTGMAQAAAVTVVFTVLAAVTLLPALLTILGNRVLSKRQRAALASGDPVSETARPSVFARWALVLQRSPRRLAALAALVLVVLALPTLSMRVGNPDTSSDPDGSPGREYVEMMAPAFGEGVDAPLVLVGETPDAAAAEAFTRMVDQLEDVDGVAAVQVAPTQPGQAVAVATVTPTSSAQTEETEDLVITLRDEVVPAAEADTGLQVYVGGETASNIDISRALMDKLPLYLGLVAVLGFLLLAMAFRSILVPLVGALSNLATICVGLGSITAIFQFGWGSELLGVGTGAPVMYIVPVIIVGVVFGLSLDYQVFLVSRMHEEWVHTRDNDRAVRIGVADTGRVIATAATIMLCVFASFGFSGERIVSGIGIGMAAAVLVDAFVVRMALVPALMKLIGPRNWSYPAWADRITPRVSIEGPDADAVWPASVEDPAVDATTRA